MRKIRSDCSLKALCKKSGIPESAFRNTDGRKTRNDKLVKSMRKDSKR